MTGDHDRLRDLAAAYALDALDPDEKREFEELLSTSSELQREVDEFREVSGLLAHGAPERKPSHELWQRLHDRTMGGPDATEVVPLVTRPPRYSRFAWAAAAAGLLVAAGLWLRNRDLSEAIANRDTALEGWNT